MIVVIDVEVLEINCLVDVEEFIQICTLIDVYVVPVGVDNCFGMSTVLSSGVGVVGFFGVGVILESYIVMDVVGTVIECNFMVSVWCDEICDSGVDEDNDGFIDC